MVLCAISVYFLGMILMVPLMILGGLVGYYLPTILQYCTFRLLLIPLLAVINLRW